MLMPETAVHEDSGLIFTQYDIRGTGKALYIHTKAKATMEQVFTDYNLGLCILALNHRHDIATLFFRDKICHINPAKLERMPKIRLLFKTDTLGRINLRNQIGRSQHHQHGGGQCPYIQKEQ